MMLFDGIHKVLRLINIDCLSAVERRLLIFVSFSTKFSITPMSEINVHYSSSSVSHVKFIRCERTRDACTIVVTRQQFAVMLGSTFHKLKASVQKRE